MSEYIDRDLALSHPYANGKYDKVHANIAFITGFESYKEWLETLPKADVRENRWIPVSERLPDNNVLVLCSAISTSISGGYTRFVGCCNKGFWFVQTDAETVSYPTMMMFLHGNPYPNPIRKAVKNET